MELCAFHNVIRIKHRNIFVFKVVQSDFLLKVSAHPENLCLPAGGVAACAAAGWEKMEPDASTAKMK